MVPSIIQDKNYLFSKSNDDHKSFTDDDQVKNHCVCMCVLRLGQLYFHAHDALTMPIYTIN